MQRLLRARDGKFSEDVEAWVGLLFGWQLDAHHRGRNGIAPRAQAERLQLACKPGGDLIVVFAGRVHGGDADELLQPAEQVSVMAVDEVCGSHKPCSVL